MGDDPNSWFWQCLDSYLARNQLKQTSQRKIIIEEFLKLNCHVEAETLHNSIKNKNNNIGLATIYRTLNLLKDAGLVSQHSFVDGRSVFELLQIGSHHDHLVCVKCGQIEEFENEAIEALQIEIAKKFQFQLTHHRLDLFGFCKNCTDLVV